MMPPARDDDLLVNLTLPTTTIRIGPLAFDGLQAVLGVQLDDVLGPLMRASRFQRPMGNGGVVDVGRSPSPPGRA